MQCEFCRDLTASSAANLPMTSASLRLVVMWIVVGSTRCTYSGGRVPPRFTFTTNLMFVIISELLTWYTGNLSAFCFRIAGARPRSAFEAEYRKTSCWFLFNASQSDSTTRDRGAVRRSRSNSGAANRQRKTQEADRFWFAPRAAKRQTVAAPDEALPHHAGLFVDLVKQRSCEPSTENARSGQVLVRTPGRRKRQTVVASGEAQPHHAALFVDLVKQRSCEPSTENAKSGQVLVRTRGGEKGRQWRFRTRRCRTMRRSSSI